MKEPGPIGLALAMSLATASTAFAQDATEDWDLTVDPAQALTLASLDFGGNAVALRCKAGMLEFLLTGVPTSTEAVRTVQVTAGGIAGESQTWRAHADTPVLSADEPDRLARQLRAGGDLELRIEPVAAGGRGMRFSLTIPPSATALDQVLSACGAALTDEWDLRPRAFSDTIVWERVVSAEYPEAAVERQIPLASVRLACIVPANGRLDECRIVFESHDGLGFGRNALAAARESRIRLPDGDLSAVGKVVHYNVRFRQPQ
ncbi:MAG: hypothetical protein Q8O54_09580 [Brevundimonas sp.]|nr:hypothetical protein [Brevundimonas sp.]